jgi:outer membrane lipoprotein-sorting protein
VNILPRSLSVLLLGLAVATAPLLAQSPRIPNVLTVKKITRNIQDAFDGIQTYKADFRIAVEEGSRKSTMKGEVRYQKPERVLFSFDEPEGQMIYSDGRVMRIYLPDLRVVAEQRMGAVGQEVMFAGSRSSFYQLLRQYHFAYNEGDVRKVDGRKYHILHLTQKNVYSGFRTIELWVSENWLIVKAVGKTREGRSVTATFSDIRLNAPMTENEFSFSLPVDVQTLYDPLFRAENR